MFGVREQGEPECGAGMDRSLCDIEPLWLRRVEDVFGEQWERLNKYYSWCVCLWVQLGSPVV